MKMPRHWPRCGAACIAMLLLLSPEAKGQSLAQPNALAVSRPIVRDAQVQPTACGEGESNRSCCCEPVCCPKCVTEEVEKSCWLVKPELVCIPGFRWPWECRAGDCDCGGAVGDGCACPPRCGRVRCVNVLEQHKYTCEECGYEWEVKCVRSGKGGACGCGGCPKCGREPACGACAATKPSSAVVLTEAIELVPASRPAARPLSFWEKLGLK